MSDDLKWNEHTAYIVKKAKQRLWRLRRLSCLGASRQMLLEQYISICRSVLETSVPVFAGGLSETNSSDIEDVQKAALKIILKNEYTNYEEALSKVEELSLKERRDILLLKFAKKCAVHPKLKHYFTKKQINKTKTMIPAPEIYVEPRWNSARGAKNPIIYLTRLLNRDILSK